MWLISPVKLISYWLVYPLEFSCLLADMEYSHGMAATPFKQNGTPAGYVDSWDSDGLWSMVITEQTWPINQQIQLACKPTNLMAYLQRLDS